MNGGKISNEIILSTRLRFLSGIRFILLVRSYITFHFVSKVYAVLLRFMLTFCHYCKHKYAPTRCF